VQFRRTSKNKSKSVSGCCCCDMCCLVSPLAPPRRCFIVGGCGRVSGGGSGTKCYGYTAKGYGRSGFAVGCLPAPLRSGPAQKTAGLPSSPPNARGPVPLSALYPRSTWGDLRCHSAGHSQQVVTGLKSTFRKAPRKSPDATCSAVQADTPLRYVTAFKLSIGERHEKARIATCGADRRSPKSRGAPR
jgi:hypothetical protein